MKHFVDQKGNKVNYGDIVHYSESVNEKNFKSFFDVHVTLTPENIGKLKSIGAIREIELKEKTIEDYNERLGELLCKDEKFIERFRSCFPAQYLSAIITLIHDDFDDDQNLKDYGFIFDLSTGTMKKCTIENGKPVSYVNIFSNTTSRDICLSIIKPFISTMYK